MDKENAEYAKNRILHSNESEQFISTCNNVGQFHKHNFEWKKAVTKTTQTLFHSQKVQNG